MEKEKRKSTTVSVFCGALAQLIHGGISLGDALMLMAEEEPDQAYRSCLKQMAAGADAGGDLSRLMEQAGTFPAYACTLTRVGQQTGKLEETLEALGRYYAARARLQQQTRSALVYPAVLLAVLLAVAVVLLVWVLPVFADVYAQLGVGMNDLAGWLLAFGALLKAALPWLAGGLAVAAVLLAMPPVRAWLSLQWNRHFGDRGVGRKLLSARFVYALSVAISSGMEAEAAVELASGIARGESAGFHARCRTCRAALEAGDSLGMALSRGGFLSPPDRRLLEAAARSGRQDEMLGSIAQSLTQDSQEALAARTARLEPTLVVASCLVIGGVLLAVMLPLLNIMNAIG